MKQAMLDEMARMSRHLWGVVARQDSDDGHGLQAIAQLLRVQERKARLIGLDAPTRGRWTSSRTTHRSTAAAELEADVALEEAELDEFVPGNVVNARQFGEGEPLGATLGFAGVALMAACGSSSSALTTIPATAGLSVERARWRRSCLVGERGPAASAHRWV